MSLRSISFGARHLGAVIWALSIRRRHLGANKKGAATFGCRQLCRRQKWREQFGRQSKGNVNLLFLNVRVDEM